MQKFSYYFPSSNIAQGGFSGLWNTHTEYGFDHVWKRGAIRQKNVTPLFHDSYYRYVDAAGQDSGKVDPRYTGHNDGENMLFTDGHVDFLGTENMWFTYGLSTP